MFPDSPFAPSRGSFQRPVAVPGVDPSVNPLIWVGFNPAWLAYIEGSLKQLLLQATWIVSGPSQLNEVQQQAFTLLYLFSKFVEGAPKIGSAGADSEDYMIRQNPDNPCQLQTSIDGVNWCTFADFSKCVNLGTSPGSGTAQPSPGGGTVKNCYVLNANGILNLGVPVSSGDVITLEVSGSGWDGSEFDFGPLWRCPDGRQFVASFCEPFVTTMGGDPVPTANHMSTIISINGTFYSIMPGVPFAVPGGITRITPFIQINDSNIADNQGSYQLCATVQNNVAPTWSKQFLSGNGNGSGTLFWQNYAYNASDGGHYDPSADVWQGDASPTIPAENDKSLAIKITIPSGSTITRVTATCKIQSTNAVGALAQQLIVAGTVEDSQNFGTDGAVHVFTLDSGAIAVAGAAEIDITMNVRGLVANGVPICEVDAITIYGSGVNPF